MHGLAFQQFHDEELTVAFLPDVVDGADMWVIESGDRARFSIETSGTQAIGSWT